MTEFAPTEGTAEAVAASGLHGKAVAAAARYLERRGMEVLERGWACADGCADLVADDEGAIVFVGVSERSGDQRGLPDEEVGEQARDAWERVAAAYLAQGDAVDVEVRFDLISLLVVGSDRAFLRHHVNAFSLGC